MIFYGLSMDKIFNQLSEIEKEQAIYRESLLAIERGGLHNFPSKVVCSVNSKINVTI